ncbi:Hypothetical predicted protein, partial [Paramuricea clavata]
MSYNKCSHPKAPVSSKGDEKPQEGELFKVKLKSTRPAAEPNKDEPAESTQSEDNANNNSEGKTRTPPIKDRSKMFQSQNGSPGKPPVPCKSTVLSKISVTGAKPTVPIKPPVNGNQNTGVTRARPPSVISKP